MTSRTSSLTSADAAALRRDLPPLTADDVGITTLDGRHLRSKREILAWLAEIEPEIETVRETWQHGDSQV